MELIHIPPETIRSNELIAVYCNKQSTESFLVGQVLMSDSNSLLLSLISPDLNFDGLCLCMAESFFRIETDSQYLLNMKKDLCSTTNQYTEGDPWDVFLRYVEAHRLRIRIKGLSGRKIGFGIPVAHSQDFVEIERVSSNDVLSKTLRLKRNKIALLEYTSDIETQLPVPLQEGVSRNA